MNHKKCLYIKNKGQPENNTETTIFIVQLLLRDRKFQPVITIIYICIYRYIYICIYKGRNKSQ